MPWSTTQGVSEVTPVRVPAALPRYLLRIRTEPDDPPEVLAVDDTAARIGTGDTANVKVAIRRMTALAERITRRYLWHREYQLHVLLDHSETELSLPVAPIHEISLVQSGNSPALEEGDEDNEYQVWPELGLLRSRNRFASDEPGWDVRWTGGYWLPSNGTPPDTGEQLISVQGSDLEQAIFEMVQLTWQLETSNRRISTARLTPLAVEYDTGMWIPKASMKVLKSHMSIMV